MTITTIDAGLKVAIPEPYADAFKVGQQVAISQDEHGRLVIAPLDYYRKVLDETFGMWQVRDDMPTDGVSYVDQIRRGKRLDDLRPAS
jgi:hypothetical protein